jgi:glycosyltransferase involved in cell wall biosynthesis
MRVVYLTQNFPPRELGGADLITYQIADGVRRLGHEPFVICADKIDDTLVPTGQIHESFEPYDNLPVWRLSFNWKSMQDPYWNLYGINHAVESTIIERLSKINPQVVHVTSCNNLSAAVLTAPRKAKIPVLFTLTGKWELCPIGTLLKDDLSICAGHQPGLVCLECMFGRTKAHKVLGLFPAPMSRIITRILHSVSLKKVPNGLNFVEAIERRNNLLGEVLNQVDVIDSPSYCHMNIFSSSGLIHKRNIIYNPHGFPLSIAGVGQTKTESDKIRFAFTGQIVPHKGLDILIRAFRRLPADLPVELHIFGDPQKDPRCSHYKELAGNDHRIYWHGPYRHDGLGKVLASVDVVVVPSNCVENSPLTIAEAFASGTPVIGSNTCGVVEHIQNGVDGLVFKRGDELDLADKLQRIATEPDLLKQLRSGVQMPRSLEDYVSQIIQIYQQLITSN